ncbi:MAG: gluconeogenesis factor YvcK family protein [archaeon]
MRKKVVTIGGGSGSFRLLEGLKKYGARKDDDDSIDIKFITTATDSGGSSGRLRDEYGILPYGDVIQGLLALSEAQEDLRELLNYRFDNGSLSEHRYGNLTMLALTNLSKGDEEAALEKAHRIFNVKGRVMPVTKDKAHISGMYKNGTVLSREDIIDRFENPDMIRIERLYSNQPIKANPRALEALAEADAIIIGPGDLYTSIICNSLSEGIVDAIKNSKALKIYNCNIMTKPSETPNYSVADHFNDIEKYLGEGVIDVVTYNNKTDLDMKLLQAYKKERKHLVEFREQDLHGRNLSLYGKDMIIEQNLLNNLINKSLESNSRLPPIRHDSNKLASLMIEIIFDEKYQSLKVSS